MTARPIDLVQFPNDSASAATVVRGGFQLVPPSPRVESTRPDATRITVFDFVALMTSHTYVFGPTGDLWPATSVNSRIGPLKDGDRTVSASAWLDAHRAVEQITWSPADDRLIENRLMVGEGWVHRGDVRAYNLYKPPTIELGNPQKAERWINLIGFLYPDDVDHIIRYFAHCRQHPGIKRNHALVFGGATGIGKDSIAAPLPSVVGFSNFHEVSPVQLTGRFNHFLKTVILRISEAHDQGDVNRYGFYEHCKTLCAAPPETLRIDEKNVKEYSIRNCLAPIFTTNHRDGLYLPPDDRRHYVTWSERTENDFPPNFWTELHAWYEAGGFTHVAAYLDSLDIQNFDPKAPPPKTPAFWTTVDAGRSPEDSELSDALEKLGQPSVVTLPMLTGVTAGSFGEWLKDRRNSRQIPHRLEAVGYVPTRNHHAKDGRWVIDGKRQTAYAKVELSTRDRIAAAQLLSEADT